MLRQVPPSQCKQGTSGDGIVQLGVRSIGRQDFRTTVVVCRLSPRWTAGPLASLLPAAQNVTATGQYFGGVELPGVERGIWAGDKHCCRVCEEKKRARQYVHQGSGRVQGWTRRATERRHRDASSLHQTVAVPGGHIPIESVANYDGNILLENSRAHEIDELCERLWNDRHNVQVITLHHLCLPRGIYAIIAPKSEWLVGDWNICMRIQVHDPAFDVPREILVKILVPACFGESTNPGTVEEKIRVTVGSYTWYQAHCPTIPVPHLYGFGLPNGLQFTHVAQTEAKSHLAYEVLNESVAGGNCDALVSNYIADECGNKMPADTGYMIFEYIEGANIQKLSDTWDLYADDSVRQATLRLSIARLMISLASAPKSKIGSFAFSDNSLVTLTNRPLCNASLKMERSGVPRVTEQGTTYNSTKAFVADMLKLHDSRISKQPDAIKNAEKCREQMGFRALLRGLAQHFIRHDLGDGVFVAQLLDLDINHIAVDSAWNITYLFDLESICVLPVEALQEPEWLCGLLVEEGPNQLTYEQAREGFMDAFEELESDMKPKTTNTISLTQTMEEMWQGRGFWFFVSLLSPHGMYDLVYPKLRARFMQLSVQEIEEVSVSLWGHDPERVVTKITNGHKKYLDKVHAAFSSETTDTSN
ncbi:hypothetical protein G7Z17_g12776 [Cylindrodendrum hubeiense]|uniref:Aminoglycoside phosphotransferase domain-containing protein n=1 Tax=Cylindrodendrum hubeiense TaxID=595255 RepID=A0A9P5GX22_9HYPO|nr:hypothetical protein G7Z17_g12776 [Cylindrodendrum hubeiense]